MPSDSFTLTMGAQSNLGSPTNPKPEQPLPYIDAQEDKYYFCPRTNSQMVRKDGFVIRFLGNVHKTRNLHTIMWLDNEIADRHPELLHATQEQIEAYEYASNPRNYADKKAKERYEAELTSRLAAALNKKLGEEKLTPEELQAMLQDTEVEAATSELTDEQKIAGVSMPAHYRAETIPSRGASLVGMSNTGNAAI